MLRRLALSLLCLLPACTDTGREVRIASDDGGASVVYDCSSPTIGDLPAAAEPAVLDYAARMTRAGLVPRDSLQAMTAAYAARDWSYLQRKVRDHACGHGVLARVEPEFPAPGTSAPTFELPTLDGRRTVTLTDFHDRYVLIEFWASWCAPCIRSLREFDAWARRSPDRLAVLGVSYGEDPDTSKAWLERSKLDHVIGLEDPGGAAAEAYLVRRRIGLSYLLDGEGRVVPACDTCPGIRAAPGDYEEILAERLGW